MLIVIKVLTIFLALGVLTVVLLAVLDATAEMVRLRLQTRRELRLRFGKRIRSRPHLEEDRRYPGADSRRHAGANPRAAASAQTPLIATPVQRGRSETIYDHYPGRSL